MKRIILLILLALAGTPAFAQPYPNRTVSVIVPYPAGGSVDVVARLLVQKLNDSMGQNFIVENRAGGAGSSTRAMEDRIRAMRRTMQAERIANSE